MHAIRCMSTKFGVDSSSHFSFGVQTHTHTNATDYSTHISATVGMSNNMAIVDSRLHPKLRCCPLTIHFEFQNPQSTKPEVHNILYCRQRRLEPQ